MLIDDYQSDANFVSARSLEVSAAPARVWEVLPMLPVALRRSRVAIAFAAPLQLASLLRGDLQRGDAGFGRKPWRLLEGEVLVGRDATGTTNMLWVERVDPGREVVLLGRHRFASYATCFRVEPAGANRSRVRNVTRARFSTRGVGGLYYAGVNLFHCAYVDWMLRHVRGLAEAGPAAARGA